MNKIFRELGKYATTKFDRESVLSKETRKEQEEKRAALLQQNISECGSGLILQKRDFVTAPVVTIEEETQTISREPQLWRYLTHIECVTNTNIPSLEEAAPAWKEVGYSNIQDLSLQGFAAKPHRLVVTSYISRILDSQSKGLVAGVLQEFMHKSENRVVETLLKSYEQPIASNDSTPSPIFTTETSVSSLSDIITATSQIKGQNMWVISPAAINDILTLFGNEALNNDKLMGYPYIVEENAEDGFFYFGDFSKVYVANWDFYPFTFDQTTKAHLNVDSVTAESYWDFKLMGGQILKLKYEQTGETEDPTEDEPTDPDPNTDEQTGEEEYQEPPF